IGPFDFVDALPHYADQKQSRRLNRRYEAIVAPFVDDIRGASVLDLASHDGRWAYALSQAGAASVLGIEGRQALIDQFAAYPNDDVKSRVTLRQGDIFDAIIELVADRATFDVIAAYGIFYHISEQYLLLSLIRRLNPKLVIIDSEFVRDQQGPILRFSREKTDDPLNTIDRGAGNVELVAVPTPYLLELMADTQGFTPHWVDWNTLPADSRDGVQDYYRTGKARKRRDTVALRPKPAVS
ncbi:unnamed protein product, partial [Chrysoparadoxa australica]